MLQTKLKKKMKRKAKHETSLNLTFFIWNYYEGIILTESQQNAEPLILQNQDSLERSKIHDLLMLIRAINQNILTF